MKAAVYRGPYNISGEEVDTPGFGAGEILIKMKASGICGSDLHTYKLGMLKETCKEIDGGGILGHEFSGEVIGVGEGVKDIAVGDRVAAICGGGMAEIVCVSPAILHANVYKLPAEVSYEEAATIEPLAVSLHAAKLGDPKDGSHVVVFGAGIIGLGVVQCLTSMGVDIQKLIVIDVSDKRLDLAKELGATHIINALQTDVTASITELVGFAPNGPLDITPASPAVDLVYDTVGLIKNNPAPPVIQQAIGMVRPNGRVVLVGVYEEDLTLQLSPVVLKHIDIQGSYGYTLPDDLLECIELIRTKKIDRNILVSHVFSLDKAKEAFEIQCDAQVSVKVIFKA